MFNFYRGRVCSRLHEASAFASRYQGKKLQFTLLSVRIYVIYVERKCGNASHENPTNIYDKGLGTFLCNLPSDLYPQIICRDLSIATILSVSATVLVRR